MKKYISNIFLALDILIAALIPGGKSRQTISGRLGNDFDGSIFELAVNKMFYTMGWWDSPDHCSDVDKREDESKIVN